MAEVQVTEHKTSRSPRRQRGRPIRLRAILVALLLLLATVLYSVWGTWQTAGVGPQGPLFGPAVAILFLLTLTNRWIGARKPTWAFTPGELILIYVTVVTAGMANGVYTWFGPFASVIVHPIWGATPSNQWAEMVWPNLAPWLTVMDTTVLEGFFLGNANPYQRSVLEAWAQPACWWAAWVTGLLWVTLCLNVLVRRRWSQEEKLAFPMTELPLQLTQPDNRLFASRLWWIGLGISAGVGVWNLCGRIYPALPTVPLSIDISNRIATGVWSALRTGELGWGFWGIGLAYLMPLDMMISLVIFNLLWRSEYLITRLLGWNTSAWSGFPYGDEQSVGAYLAIFFSVLWVDRRYVRHLLRKVIGLPSAADDRDEPFSYRTALLGVMGGVFFLTWFMDRAGVPTQVALSFLGLYFIMMMVLSRVRAQIGPPDNELYGAMPQFFLTQFPGTRWVGPRGLGMIALMTSLLHEQTNNPSPVQLEALRMAERRTIGPRLLSIMLIVIIPLIVLLYFGAHLTMGYHHGLEVGSNIALVQMPSNVAGELDAWLRNPSDTNWSGTQAMGVGALITVILMAVKLRFPSWPLHPVAFPLAWSWPIDAITPAIFGVWIVKLVLLRYGGLRAHRTALPLFLGFIVGDTLTGILWQILRVIVSG